MRTHYWWYWHAFFNLSDVSEKKKWLHTHIRNLTIFFLRDDTLGLTKKKRMCICISEHKYETRSIWEQRQMIGLNMTANDTKLTETKWIANKCMLENSTVCPEDLFRIQALEKMYICHQFHNQVTEVNKNKHNAELRGPLRLHTYQK